MRLHEYYFENLGGKGDMDKNGKLSKKMAEDFGSYENREKEFKGVGVLRGIGWAILYQDSLTGKLVKGTSNNPQFVIPAQAGIQ